MPGIVPLAPDYSDKDFDALRARLFDLIGSVFPDWTDDAAANFGNLLVEAHAFMGDVLHFYQDQQARETRFATVQLRRNMISLAKMAGYTLSPATAATADVVARILNAGVLTGEVRPSGVARVVVKTAAVTSPVRGELALPIGDLYFDLGLGETEKTFPWIAAVTQPPLSVASTGKADQQIILPFGPFLDDGGEVVATPTQPLWTRVDNFFSSGATDTHYRVQVDQNDKATIIFGDGRNGAIPVGLITVYPYRVGGGPGGLVDAGSLTRCEATWIDALGRAATIEFTNPYRAEGGYPREEVESARVNIPASQRVLTRTVCREDYEINARRVPGVGRALMLTRNEYAGIPENRGKLFIVPLTGGTPSQTMIDAVTTMVTVTYPRTITFQLEVLPANYLDVAVTAIVYRKPNTAAPAVRAAILAALEDYFSPMLADGTPNPLVDFGYYYRDANDQPAGEIPWSDLFNAVRDADGVRKVDPGGTGFLLNGVRDDVSLPVYQFPRLGTVTLIDGDTGGAI